MKDIWTLDQAADGPLIAVAVHNGHAVRDDVRRHLALSDADRLREEDPFTGMWTSIGHTRIVGLRSRFEVDLNRDEDKAVYLKPADAWGLDVWKDGPPPHVIDESLEEYAAFYERAHRVLKAKEREYGWFLVYDLHSYNHRRGGPEHEPDDPKLNPEINVGTGTMDRSRWAPVVDTFIETLRKGEVRGHRLDVRENVKFKGGHFSRWIHSRFPESGCSLAIEVKKFFMDEWTGEPFWDIIESVRGALEQTVQPTLEAMNEIHR